MIRINKAERDYLLKHGVGCGENGVSRTHSHSTSWYLCESEKNLLKLDKYRQANVVSSFE